MKHIILALAIAMSGMAHADFQAYQGGEEVQKADAEDALGALIGALIIGKIVKEIKDKKNKKKPVVQTETIRIPMGGELAVGENTIFLKRELRAMGIIPRHRVLKSVTLVAKSRAGHAQAYLELGNTDKPMKTIGQAQGGFSFQSERPASYNRITWRANSSGRDGVWQIHMRGRIKVKAVIVELL